MIEILQDNMLSVGAFFLGVVIGFILGLAVKSEMKNTWNSIINITVFAMWTISMGLDFYTGQQQTSVFLHIFFGTVIGLSNPEARDFLLSALSRKK